MIEAINPLNQEVIDTYEPLSKDKLEAAIEAAHETHLQWRTTDFKERAEKMQRAAHILKDNKEAYAELMTREMGKTLKSAISEVEKCAWVCEYYAENAQKFLSPDPIETDADKSYVAYQPLGVVLAVMPWNFPFWQVFRFAAPALMAGNVGLLKHASNVPACALAIEEVFHKAGFPQGAFQTLLIRSDKVSAVIEHPLVKAVTLTGSTPAGQAVASKAGEMLKKTVLELGGSDPYLILEDADLDLAVEQCVTSRLINNGQSCIAAKRFIVVQSVLNEFQDKFVALMKSKVMGDPMNEDTDIGPQARHDLRDELHEQVRASLEKGAKCLLGGHIPDDKGAFYPPTVLGNVTPGMPAYDEELFGPVAAIIAAKNTEDAVRIANDSEFGLGAAVFSQNTQKAEEVALQIEAGACFVNSFVKSDPRLPFGGIKKSGYGRELSALGIREFVNIKTVSITQGE